MSDLDIKLKSIENSPEMIMQVTAAVLAWNAQNKNDKGLWKGHADFLTNVHSYFVNHQFLSPKQRDSVLRTLGKYERIVLPILDSFEEIDDMYDSTLDVDESIELIFDKSDFDGICPNCEKPYTADVSEDDDMHATVYKCMHCGCVSKYVNNMESE